jgi:hypothetical protein
LRLASAERQLQTALFWFGRQTPEVIINVRAAMPRPNNFVIFLPDPVQHAFKPKEFGVHQS